MNFYVVHKGKNPGIYKTWIECKKEVEGYTGAMYKKFDNIKDAEIFLKNGFNQKTLEKYSKKNNLTKKIDEKNEKILDELLKKKDNKIFIYTDGSCLKFKNNIIKAGYGIYIPEKDIKISKSLKEKQTNNRAELTAIIDCVEYLSDEDLKKELIIITDSSYSMFIFDKTGENYEKNNFIKDNKTVLNKDLVIKALEIKRKYNIKLVKIRAHTLKNDIHSKNNEIVDKLAKEGARNNSEFNDFNEYKDKNVKKSIYTKYHEVYQKTPDKSINDNITMNDIFEYDECSIDKLEKYKKKTNAKNLGQWFIPIKK